MKKRPDRVRRYDAVGSNQPGGMPALSDLVRRCLRSPLACLIAVNTLVFVVVSLTYAVSSVVLPSWLGMFGPAAVWIYQPWGMLSYMFVQSDVLHLLFNMMWLWAFGAMMTRMDGGRTLVWTYIVSGIGGALFFLATATIGSFGPMCLIGSSASVLGVIAGATARNPRQRLSLVLFGDVELRWVALVAIVLCGVAAGWGSWPTVAAHLGGAVTGWVFIKLRYRQRRQVRYTHHSGPIKVRAQQRRGLQPADQAELDSLLDRVRQSGYKNLSTKEQRRLFELSNKIRQ